jgi:hypothetical protein
MTPVYVLAESAKEKAAVKAAEAWLALVDSGKYAESWQEAAGYFRGAVDKAQWEKSLLSVRKPLGKMIRRKVISAKYYTSLPGAPDGQYVVIQFETSFEKKIKAIETVTPMFETDGVWRVSGYYIK